MPKYKNPGPIKFTAEIFAGHGGGMFVEFPKDVEFLFGVKGRVPVKASFDGIPYRGSLLKMGTDCHCIGVLKEIRNTLKKTSGDKVQVIIELDEEERKIELAPDVVQVLNQNTKAKAFWETLSFTNQREYHEWIESAKRRETRAKRIAEMVEKLGSKES
jgi:hypothetical protein